MKDFIDQHFVPLRDYLINAEGKIAKDNEYVRENAFNKLLDAYMLIQALIVLEDKTTIVHEEQRLQREMDVEQAEYMVKEIMESQ